MITSPFIFQSLSWNTDDHFYLVTVTYPGFPFPPHTPLYPTYDYVQAYHHDFATHFKLQPYIRLNHSVESAYWIGSASEGFWELSISTRGPQAEIIPFNNPPARNSRHRSVITKRFDHLVVASGHNHYPKFPPWAADDTANEWLRNGSGRRIVHSIYFRGPGEYSGKVILVVGAGPSGVDIVALSSGHAKKVCLRPSSPLAEITDNSAHKVYHSFSPHGQNKPSRTVPGTVYKPRTKCFTSSSVQFEDGTEVFDVDIVVLATGYEYRFPFLDPADPYSRPTRGLPAHERHAVMTTNASAYSRPKGENRLTLNLKYLFPTDRQIVSLSPLHPLNALLFIGLPFPIVSAPSAVAQSLFAGHLIARPDQVYPTSHITGHEGWNETLARELLIKNLTALEDRLADEGFDVYHLGHKLNIGSYYSGSGYQDSLVAHLQSHGLVPPHDGGYIFVEPWRIIRAKDRLQLRIIWMEIESRGEEEAKRWLDGVETEEEWADLMVRVLRWGKEQGIQ